MKFMKSYTSDKEIPIFFATNDNYAPFLAVALKSMLKHASKDYFYRIYVLTTNLSDDYKSRLKQVLTENSSLEYISLQKELDKFSELFHLRDYYSKETYYRFFIANLFPQYKKVLYLDCDIVVLGDISELYNVNVSNYMLAGVQEEVMDTIEVFGNYVEKTLGIKCKNYINAGILLINTERFRQKHIEQRFVELINKFTFTVTQDQDYLNVLCKDQIKYLNLGWNKTAFFNPKFHDKNLKIVHYKMNWKPWNYDDVLYGNYFWKYAKQTDFYSQIQQILWNYSDEKKHKDQKAYKNLVKQALNDTNDPNNYYNTLKNDRDIIDKLEDSYLHYYRKYKNFVVNSIDNIEKISKVPTKAIKSGYNGVKNFVSDKGHKTNYGSRNK